MGVPADPLRNLIDLEDVGADLFRSQGVDVDWRRAFGGETIAQALSAAQRTVSLDRPVHSLHGYFIGGRDTAAATTFSVERIRDGSSFSIRKIVVAQDKRLIATLDASFHVEESGLEYQDAPPPGIPAPESLQDILCQLGRLGTAVAEPALRYWSRDWPVEVRPVSVQHYAGSAGRLPQCAWIRLRGPAPLKRHERMAVLAYLSDLTLMGTAMVPHGRALLSPEIQSASLDHAVWFHRDHALDGWLLYVHESPRNAGARALVRGAFYARDGQLIASVAQEGLIRVRP